MSVLLCVCDPVCWISNTLRGHVRNLSRPKPFCSRLGEQKEEEAALRSDFKIASNVLMASENAVEQKAKRQTEKDCGGGCDSVSYWL